MRWLRNIGSALGKVGNVVKSVVSNPVVASVVSMVPGAGAVLNVAKGVAGVASRASSVIGGGNPPPAVAVRAPAPAPAPSRPVSTGGSSSPARAPVDLSKYNGFTDRLKSFIKR